MARPRKQTYTLDMYLKKINDGDIDNNADVQRRMVWSKEQINELVVTVLTDEYIPPIILGEENNSQLHITDGGCRSAALNSFWNGTHKITSAIENSIIFYKKKIKREDGSIDWEDAAFDIKNKTFEKLPEELKKKFNEYQIETVIHENCDSYKISKYIKRYNNHTSMNADQKAFTYIDKFAGCIRKILDSRFFLDNSVYSENDKTKGVVERIIVETLMCTNHFDCWTKQPKVACKYLNCHATEKEFEKLDENLHRLENIIDNDVRDIFNKKDSFIFLTLFERFTNLGFEDGLFAEFLREFKGNLREKRRNSHGLLFDEIKQNNSTKDKSVIAEKLDMLEALLAEFLHVDKNHTSLDSLEEFIVKTLGMNEKAVREDMSLYNDSLDILLDNTVKIDSKLRNKENRPSLLAMIAYSYKEDQDLDKWMEDFAKNNPSYLIDQRKNFTHMKNAFEEYCKLEKSNQT
ncbi:MAG: DUF262 domain-containing protein [Lachnospiraceae bacterium]|nr:DUF262 domain-containing protein [Lachnospiraceae bacterium]